jgi:hypothetical protein
MLNPIDPNRPDTPDSAEDAAEREAARSWDALYAGLQTLAGGELSEVDALLELTPQGKAA